jgi:oxalate decarboxylase
MTDVHGSQGQAGLPGFRFPMEAQEARSYEGGSAKEATAAEFPISQRIAGVSMRLVPGGLRELHWHATAAEWAYVITGQCRITFFDPAGNREVDDFGPGDIWFFPRGYPHSIQAVGDEECHFILVFDDGHFSEFATFSVTDWVGHTPPEVLAKDLDVPPEAFAAFPKNEVYIAKGPVPPPLPEQPPAGSLRDAPLTHKYRLGAQEPRLFDGGYLRLASAEEFPVSTTMTGLVMTVHPGGQRALHWHPNADEWQYYIRGRARMTLFGSQGRARTEEFGPGDVGYAPMGYGHYIENVGDEDVEVILVLSSGHYQSIFLSRWLASNPRQLVATNFGVGEDVVERFRDSPPRYDHGWAPS